MNILDLFRLDGKTAIVTGGSGLYGKQIVLALAQAGAKVYTASRNLENNEEYAANLRAEGLAVYGEHVDQGEEDSVLSFKNRIIENEGKIDILVNNSVLRTMSNFNDDAEHFNESLRINGTGVFLMSRAFGNHMSENGGGSIINIASYMGILGADDSLYKGLDMISGFNVPDYFFHKGGMINLTRLIAGYYGPQNVRCNALTLGGFYSGQDETFVRRYNDRTFLKRMANKTDIMGIIVFLASDASAYVTGTSIPIDGGYSAK